MQTQELILKIASDRSGGKGPLTQAWIKSLDGFPSLPEDAFERFARAMPNTETAQYFRNFLLRDPTPKEALAQFFAEVDESEETLEEWLNAFEVLAYYLESTPFRPALSKALGYLHCCAAVSHTGARYATFPMTVENMLETYGFSGDPENHG